LILPDLPEALGVAKHRLMMRGLESRRGLPATASSAL